MSGLSTSRRSLNLMRNAPSKSDLVLPPQGRQTPSEKLLEDYLMHKVVLQAAEHRLPMQIHTGLQAGNTNHLSWTNPSHLSGLLNQYPQVRFDLFHGG